MSMTSSTSAAIGLTMPFGGKVLTTKIPSVTCVPGAGTGPVVLISNLAAIGQTVASTTSGSTVQRIGNAAVSAYNILPFYTVSPTKKPKAGGYVLGRHELIPDLKLCYSSAFGGFPVPVKKTTNFGVSKPGLK